MAQGSIWEGQGRALEEPAEVSLRREVEQHPHPGAISVLQPRPWAQQVGMGQRPLDPRLLAEAAVLCGGRAGGLQPATM